eukprot:Selendium_serpulae@DN9425_c0_g1_i1.p1
MVIIPTTCVSVLHTPQQFYECLTHLFGTATERLLISSLYIGDGERVSNLVNLVESQLSNTDLKVDVVLDYHRGLRHGTSAHNATSSNSVEMCTPIIRHKEKCNVRLFANPLVNPVLVKLFPPRVREIFGVMHAKAIVADDKVVITGANLSENYLTNRQDRYVVIDSHHLANQIQKVMQGLMDCSFRVSHNMDISPPGKPCPNPMSDARNFRRYLAHRFAAHNENIDTAVVPPPFGFVNCSVHLQAAFATPALRNEESMLSAIFARSQQIGTQCLLSTAYPNLSSKVCESLSNRVSTKGTATTIITAAPSANSFHNSKGLTRHVDDAYATASLHFLKRILNGTFLTRFSTLMANRAPSRELKQSPLSYREFERDGWTFHAKGVWIQTPSSPSSQSSSDHSSTTEPDVRTFMTVVGSSNFGHRSHNRDVEMSVLFCELRANAEASLPTRNQFSTIMVPACG